MLLRKLSIRTRSRDSCQYSY